MILAERAARVEAEVLASNAQAAAARAKAEVATSRADLSSTEALIGRLKLQEHHHCNILIVGSGEWARLAGVAVEEHSSWGLRLAGYIQEDSATGDGRVPVCGSVQNFREIMSRQVIDGVIFAVT